MTKGNGVAGKLSFITKLKTEVMVDQDWMEIAKLNSNCAIVIRLWDSLKKTNLPLNVKIT